MKKPIRLPHAFVILFACIFLAAVLSWVVPAGEFDRVAGPTGAKLVVPGTWHQVDQRPAGLLDIFTAIPKGLIGAASVVFAVFLIGGGFGIVEETGVIPIIVDRTVRSLGGRGMVLIPVVMIMFSVICAFIGLVELSIIYTPILVPICLGLGFDSMTAVGIALIACGGGFTAALTNPFTVALAQKIGGLPLYSGMPFRVAFLSVITLTGIIYVSWYAARVRRNPAASFTADIDKVSRAELTGKTVPEFTPRMKLTAVVFLGGLLLLIVGILKWKWYLNEIGAFFVILGALAGLCAGMSVNGIAERFVKGLEGFVVAAFAAGLARGVVVVLEEARILDTVVMGIASVVQQLPGSVTAVGMMIAQTLMSVPIPSGSGLTLISMPVMFPVADLAGVTRQTAILALQVGDGFTNIIAPTLGFLWAALGAARVPYERWCRFYFPLFLAWLVISAAFLVVAQLTGWS